MPLHVVVSAVNGTNHIPQALRLQLCDKTHQERSYFGDWFMCPHAYFIFDVTQRSSSG